MESVLLDIIMNSGIHQLFFQKRCTCILVTRFMTSLRRVNCALTMGIPIFLKNLIIKREGSFFTQGSKIPV